MKSKSCSRGRRPYSPRIATTPAANDVARVATLAFEYSKSYQNVTGASAKFIPKSAIAEKPVAARAAAAVGAVAEAAPAGRAFRREALDAVKKSAGYEIQPCSCGAKIKIPNGYPQRNKIRCLACGRKLGDA
ncbi:MAG: hypothetical protein V3T05_02105 [Myxococcota bacterium]